MKGNRQLAPWQQNQDLDDAALVWRAAVREGLTHRRSRLNPFSGGFGPAGFLGGLGAATGGRLFTGPAADALAHAQRSALRGDSGTHASTNARMAALERAALQLTERFTTPELESLRESGELPDWFPEELTRLARDLRKKRDGSSA